MLEEQNLYYSVRNPIFVPELNLKTFAFQTQVTMLRRELDIVSSLIHGKSFNSGACTCPDNRCTPQLPVGEGMVLAKFEFFSKTFAFTMNSVVESGNS